MLKWLGTVMYNDWDWASAEQELQRAISYNPGYAKAYRYYRDYYLIMGDVDKAIELVERAHAVDRLSQHAAVFMAFTYVFFGRHEEAYENTQI